MSKAVSEFHWGGRHSAHLAVVAGFIGKITLQIPFYRPHSDPWVISMSQLNLIIGPTPPQEYDEEKEREDENERKKRLLKALEDKFKVGRGFPWSSAEFSICFVLVLKLSSITSAAPALVWGSNFRICFSLAVVLGFYACICHQV